MIQGNWTVRPSAPQTSARGTSVHRSLTRLSAITGLLLVATSFLQAQTPTIVAGTPPGQFGVSSGGSASYTIPISVPPGVAGMQPSLALSYNSQGGSGLVGMGWGLGGLSAITRCPQTMTSDGARTGINFDLSDRYCLGGQRLILLSGSEGAAGAHYRTEMESFSNIFAYGSAGNGPAYFIQKTKDGLTIEYGNSTDSRIEAQGKTTARVWAQNKVSDNKGNYLTASYTEDNANGAYRVARIDYTGNANATPALSPSASVQWSYESRPDIETGYQAGSLIQTSQRVTNIKTYSGATLVRDYRLSYEQSSHTQRSRLKSVMECDGANACLQATSLAWPAVAGGLAAPAMMIPGSTVSGGDFTALASTYGVIPTSPAYVKVADFNGDGKMDFMWLAPYGNLWQGPSGNGTPQGYLWHVSYAAGNGFTAPAALSVAGQTDLRYMHLGDFNGDGKTDVMYWSGGWRVAQSTGDGFADPVTVIPGMVVNGGDIMTDPMTLPVKSDPIKVRVADFNGDGKMDFTWQAAKYSSSFTDPYSEGTNAAHWFVAYATAGGFTAPVDVSALPGFAAYADTTLFGDFNGDGKTDVMVWNGGWLVAYSTGIGFAAPITAVAGHTVSGGNYAGLASSYGTRPKKIAQVRMADFNGDGKMDIMWPAPFGYSGAQAARWYIAYATDTGFTAPVAVAGLPDFDEATDMTLLGDFNGDGKTDLLYWNAGWRVAYATGNGFSAPVAVTPDDTNPSASYFMKPANANQVRVTDFNGDGKMDFLWPAPARYSAGALWHIAYASANGFTTPAAVSELPWFTAATDMTVIGDFNGDGKTDVMNLFYGNPNLAPPTTAVGGAYYHLIPGWRLVAPRAGHDTLTSITRGDGYSTSIVYKPITDGGIYSKDSGVNAALYPVQDIQAPFHVVASASSSNGVGGVNSTSYSYGGLKTEANTGRGMLGFRWVKSTDTSTGLERYTEYRQDYPYTGMAAKSETRLAGSGNGGVLKRATITPACNIPQTGAACTLAPGKSYFPFVASQLEESWDLSGTAHPSSTSTVTYSTFPHYGGPSQTSISSTEGWSKTTALEYWPADTANWIVGRLKKSTVTSVKP